MEKAIIIFITIILAILVGVNSYAADVNIELNLTGPTTIVQDDKTITLTLSLGNFTGIADNCVLGYEAKLEYDKNIFESVTVNGLNGWTSNYSDSTKILIGDVSSAKGNTKITEIVLTLKEGVQPTTTDIKLNNIIVTNDENDFEYNKTVTVTIQGKQIEEVTNNTTVNPENTTSNNKITTLGKNTDATTASKKIPATGTGMTIIVGIIILMIIVLTSGKGYISYLKNTNKQFKDKNK